LAGSPAQPAWLFAVSIPLESFAEVHFMPPTRITRADKVFHVRDETRRPMSLVRVRFHPTEPRLLGQTVDRMLAVWDLTAPATENRDRNLGPAVLGGRHAAHEAGWIRGFDVSADGQLLVTGGSDRHLKSWRFSDGRPADAPVAEVATAHDGWVEAVAISPEGQIVASVGSDRRLKLWNAANLEPVRTITTPHTGIIRDTVWTRDGRFLLTGGEDGKVVLWNGQSFEPVRTIDFGAVSDQQGQHPAVSGVHRLACSGDGRWLAAAGDRNVTIFNLESGEPVATDAVRLQAAFHPSADVLAAGGDTVKVWLYEPQRFAPASGRPPRTGPIPGRELGSIRAGDFSLGIAFSPDGSKLAVGKSSGTVELWELS
jgi:WD40 repeat protein